MWDFDFYSPTRIVFGEGKLAELGPLASVLSDGVVILTGRSSMKDEGFLDEAVESIENSGVRVVAIVEGVPPNPTRAFVNGTRDLLAGSREDFQVVIGLGGGSALDAAKAVAFALANPGDIWDYIDPKTKKQPHDVPLPTIAVPSTAGTGSETSRNAVITNPELPAKCALSGPWLFPRIAVIDPRLSATQPPRLAAATAVDTFSHLFENFTQNVNDPVTDLFNLEGIRLVVEFLPKALDDPGNLEHRAALALASAYGGIVLGISGAHIGHALEHPISARKDVSHGEGLAAVLPGLMERLEEHLPERMAKVRDVFEGEGPLAERFVAFLDKVRLEVSLDGLGVGEDEDPAVAQDAFDTMKGAIDRAPFIPTHDDLVDILQRSRRLLGA